MRNYDLFEEFCCLALSFVTFLALWFMHLLVRTSFLNLGAHFLLEQTTLEVPVLSTFCWGANSTAVAAAVASVMRGYSVVAGLCDLWMLCAYRLVGPGDVLYSHSSGTCECSVLIFLCNTGMFCVFRQVWCADALCLYASGMNGCFILIFSIFYYY